MMKPLRLFYHVNSEPPAYLENYLQKRNFPYEVVCLNENTPIPDNTESLSGLVFMGGAGNVNEPTVWMNQEFALIQQAAETGMPMLGICLGAQLISRALGGEIKRGNSLEVGWHTVDQLDAQGQDWFADLDSSFEVFQWHEYAFSLPPGAVPLATSRCFELQAFALNNILAMQFHLEMTPELIESLITRFSSDLEPTSNCVQGLRRFVIN